MKRGCSRVTLRLPKEMQKVFNVPTLPPHLLHQLLSCALVNNLLELGLLSCALSGLFWLMGVVHIGSCLSFNPHVCVNFVGGSSPPGPWYPSRTHSIICLFCIFRPLVVSLSWSSWHVGNSFPTQLLATHRTSQMALQHMGCLLQVSCGKHCRRSSAASAPPPTPLRTCHL